MTNDLFSRNWAYISDDIQKKIGDTKILIAGVGLGSVMAETAARTGFSHFVLADGDVVERSNLNRQAYREKDLNVNKARATRDNILAINPSAKVEIIEEYLTPETLPEAITPVDVVINTIDFDHPAFLDCNRIAEAQGKTVLFPMNLGWGGALFVFNESSASIEETIGLAPEADDLEIKKALVLKALSNGMPDYLARLSEDFEMTKGENWPCDPQLAVGAQIIASLTVTTMFSLLAGNKVRLAPEPNHVDFVQLLMGDN